MASFFEIHIRYLTIISVVQTDNYLKHSRKDRWEDISLAPARGRLLVFGTVRCTFIDAITSQLRTERQI